MPLDTRSRIAWRSPDAASRLRSAYVFPPPMKSASARRSVSSGRSSHFRWRTSSPAPSGGGGASAARMRSKYTASSCRLAAVTKAMRVRPPRNSGSAARPAGPSGPPECRKMRTAGPSAQQPLELGHRAHDVVSDAVEGALGREEDGGHAHPARAADVGIDSVAHHDGVVLGQPHPLERELE